MSTSTKLNVGGVYVGVGVLFFAVAYLLSPEVATVGVILAAGVLFINKGGQYIASWLIERYTK